MDAAIKTLKKAGKFQSADQMAQQMQALKSQLDVGTHSKMYKLYSAKLHSPYSPKMHRAYSAKLHNAYSPKLDCPM